MVIDPEPRLAGLWFLIRNASNIGKVLYSGLADRYEIPTQLPAHPFGLSIPADIASADYHRIELLGHPGGTEVSIRTMAAYVADRIGLCTDSPRYLRTILGECDPDDPAKHLVYYEVGWRERVFICGGCTDCSGGGGAGKRQMDALFAFLGQFFSINLETAIVPYAEAEEVERYLCRMVDSEAFWKQEMLAAGR